MAHGLRLIRYKPVLVQTQYYTAYRVRIEATNPVGFDGNVFLYKREPVNPHTGVAMDTFQAIAGPADLAEYWIGAPDPDKAFPFFRLDYIELDLRAESILESLWTKITHEITILLTALDRLADLEFDLELQLGATDGSTSS